MYHVSSLVNRCLKFRIFRSGQVEFDFLITTKSFTYILINSISIFYIFFFPSNLECKLTFYGYLFGKDDFICIIHIHFLFFMPGTFFQGFRLLHTKGLFLLHLNSSTSMWFMTFKSVSLCSIADPFKF